MPSGLLIPGAGPGAGPGAAPPFAATRRSSTVDALLLNSFEGGSGGVAVTPANSGGPVSNNFEFVTGTVTYDAAQAAHGLLSMRADLAAGTTSGAFWNTSFGSPARFQGRDHFRAAGAPQVVARLFQTVLGASAVWGVAVDVTGKIGVRNLQAGTWATGGLSTHAPTPNDWHRYEFDATWERGDWTVVLYLFLDNNVDGVVPDEVLTTTGGLTFAGPVASYRFGAFTSASTTWTAWHDSIGLTTRGLLGPDLSPPRDPALAGLVGRTLYPGRGPSNFGRFFSTPRSTDIITAAAAVTLQGVAQSASLPAGTLQVSRALAGTVAAATRPAASLQVSRALQAATLPASRPAGTLSISRALVGPARPTSRPAATLTLQRAFQATARPTSALAAAASVSRALTAVVRPSSAATATATVTRALQAASRPTARLSGTATVSRAFQATSRPQAAPQGTLTVTAAGQVTLAAASSATSRPAATLTVTRALAASTAATVRPAATLTVRRALAVAVASTARPAASVTVRRAVAASVRAVARVQAAVQVVTPSTRAPRFLIGAPVAKWVERGPARKWTAGQPVAKWTVRGPVRKWRIGAPVRKWPPGPPTP